MKLSRVFLIIGVIEWVLALSILFVRPDADHLPSLIRFYGSIIIADIFIVGSAILNTIENKESN